MKWQELIYRGDTELRIEGDEQERLVPSEDVARHVLNELGYSHPDEVNAHLWASAGVLVIRWLHEP